MSATNTINVPGTLGATRRSWREVSTRDLLAKLIRDNPRTTDAELLGLYEEAVRESEAYLASVIEYAFTNDLRAYRDGLRKTEPAPVRPAREAIRAAVATKATEAFTKHVEVKAKLVLLDLAMPNGKALRDCTGRECGELAVKAGGWLKAISKRLQPTQTVGSALSETELRALYKSA